MGKLRSSPKWLRSFDTQHQGPHPHSVRSGPNRLIIRTIERSEMVLDGGLKEQDPCAGNYFPHTPFLHRAMLVSGGVG